MSGQQMLFYDSAEQAVENAIQLSAKGFKAVAAALWPSLKQETAYARLKASLNPDKSEKLTLDEIAFICRFTGRADPLFYLADELNFMRPEPLVPRDEAAHLLEQFQLLTQQQKILQERLERVIETDREILNKARV